MDLRGEAVCDAEEEISEEDADDGGSCELDGEGEHESGESAGLFPVGAFGSEDEGGNELIDGNESVRLSEAVEKEERAIEAEENSEKDVVEENTDWACLALRGGVINLKGGRTARVIDKTARHLHNIERDRGKKSENDANEKLF